MKILTGYLINNRKEVIAQYSVNVMDNNFIDFVNIINKTLIDIKTDDEYIIFTIEEYNKDNKLVIRTINEIETEIKPNPNPNPNPNPTKPNKNPNILSMQE